jgi:nicotinate-nucleotide adenylyltransferase
MENFMKKQAFFGGTFDPIHHGHINLAIHLKEIARLDEVIFCPANISPFKTEKPPIASSKQRLEMLKSAIAEIEGFTWTDMELKRKDVSYTVDSIQELYQENKTGVYLVLSEETYSSFSSWKEYKKILQMAHPLVGCSDKKKIAIKEPFTLEDFIEIPYMDISSTMLRRRLKEKLYCGHLLHAKVLDFICQNEIYY